MLCGIYIPPKTTAIDATAFAGTEGFTLYGEAGTVTEQYALDHDIWFQPMK